MLVKLTPERTFRQKLTVEVLAADILGRLREKQYLE
jgi:hypothetical protein